MLVCFTGQISQNMQSLGLTCFQPIGQKVLDLEPGAQIYGYVMYRQDKNEMMLTS